MTTHSKPGFEVEPLAPFYNSNDLVLDFGQIIAILRRGWLVIAACGFIGTLIAVVLVLQVTPTYTSTAKLLLGQKSRVDDAMGAMFPNLRLDDATVSGEIAILTSERLLARVSQSLELHRHPNFNPALATPETGPGYLELATDWGVNQIKRVLGMETDTAPVAEVQNAGNSPVRNAAMTGKNLLGDQADYTNKLSSGLRVSQSGRSNLLNIRFISTDRMLAAAVPNKLVDLYLEDQVNRRFGVLSRASSRLEQQLQSMRQRLEESERAVIEFRNSGFSEGYDNLEQLQQQMTDLTMRLSALSSENAELASDLDGIDTMIHNQGALATVGMFSSPIIDSLMKEIFALSDRADRLTTQFGNDTPRMEELRSEIARLEDSLTATIIRLRDDKARMVELGARRISVLRTELRKMEQRAITQAKREIQLAQLEREQNAARVVYETFLDRFSETRETLDLQEGDAQVISYADPPPAPFAPNKKLSAVLGGMAGVFSGIAILFLRRLAHSRVTNTAELERLLPRFTTLPLPRVRRLFKRRGLAAFTLRSAGPSLLGEAIRSLRSTVLLARTSRTPIVASVVSPNAGDGKTTTAINLARSIAQAGRSCVLVDADLRKGRIAKLMNIKAVGYLDDLLHPDGPNVNLDLALVKDPETSLQVILSKNGVADPGATLLSRELRGLIAKLEERFDVVIFDTVPLLGGSDALPLVQRSDAVVLVVARGCDTDEIRIAHSKISMFDFKTRSAVLNFVPEQEFGTYSY